MRAFTILIGLILAGVSFSSSPAQAAKAPGSSCQTDTLGTTVMADDQTNIIACLYVSTTNHTKVWKAMSLSALPVCNGSDKALQSDGTTAITCGTIGASSGATGASSGCPGCCDGLPNGSVIPNASCYGGGYLMVPGVSRCVEGNWQTVAWPQCGW